MKEVEEGFILRPTEATQTVTPEANPGLKVIEIVVPRNYPDKSAKLQPGQLVDKASLGFIGGQIKLLGGNRSTAGLPFCSPGLVNGFRDRCFNG